MPIYTYQALKQGKDVVKGEVTASNLKDARDIIRKMGYVPTKITEYVDPALKKSGRIASLSLGEKIDYDLLGFNQTMLYSQVTNIVNDYQSYLGKRIRIKGNMQVVDGGNGKYYYMVNCGDATACCTSGFEFILKGGSENPSDYPENGKEITVNGVLQEYYEGEQKYIHLVDSTVSSIVKSK